MPIIEMTEKQLAFAEAVAGGKSYAEAYRLAGYALNKKDPTRDRQKAAELSRNPKVAAAIAEKKRENADAGLWERTQTLERLLEIANQAQENTLVLDKSGKIRRYNSQAAGVALRAIEQASKMCGYNAPEEVKNEITVEFKDLEEFAK